MFSTFRRNDGISADEPSLEHDGVVIRHRELGILRADADRLDIRAEDKAVDDIELCAGASGAVGLVQQAAGRRGAVPGILPARRQVAERAGRPVRAGGDGIA